MAKRAESQRHEQGEPAKSAAELRGLLIEMLTGATDHDATYWRVKVGAVETVPVWSSPHSNWRVKGYGSKQDKLSVDTAAEIVRKHHPYAKSSGK